ncbi:MULTISPECIES: hypothetical protein [unclassified Modestobacter]
MATAAWETVLGGHLTEHTADAWAAAWRSALGSRARSTRRGALAPK